MMNFRVWPSLWTRPVLCREQCKNRRCSVATLRGRVDSARDHQPCAVFYSPLHTTPDQPVHANAHSDPAMAMARTCVSSVCRLIVGVKSCRPCHKYYVAEQDNSNSTLASLLRLESLVSRPQLTQRSDQPAMHAFMADYLSIENASRVSDRLPLPVELLQAIRYSYLYPKRVHAYLQ